MGMYVSDVTSRNMDALGFVGDTLVCKSETLEGCVVFGESVGVCSGHMMVRILSLKVTRQGRLQKKFVLLVRMFDVKVLGTFRLQGIAC